LATALAQTGADVAQSALGLSGAGVKVAVMDTGVDYDHPDLGGCFGAGCRVAVGHDFVGDAYNNDSTSPSYSPIPVPDNDPDDCNGHGTHVAGIVGASGAVTGVAPGVTFGAYRVFGCAGSTSADIMIAAMERALADGMDVLNMSIGSSFQWPQYPTAAASDRAVNQGMIVVASIGNSGANGLYSGGAPGVGKKVIGVASFNNTHLNLPVFTISPDDKQIGYSSAAAAPPTPLSGTFPMARTGTAASTNDACNAVAPPAGSLTGKVALIRRGTCTFHEKARNAQTAGAAGVVIYNNVAGLQNITVAGPVAITIPVVSITAADGVLINDRLALGPVDLTWTDDVISIPNATGNLISSFSSYGLSPDLGLKPDIGAPGGLIRSTFPLELGAYATISGTSMSSPHVAGATALLLEARPSTNSQSARTILQNSADPKLWWGSPGLGFLDNVHRQGAGMLDIDDAVLSTATVTPGKLSLGESAGGPAVQTLTVENHGASDVTYDLAHVPALATGPNTFTPAFFNAPASVGFSSPTLLVPAGGSASVDVTITPNAGLADKSLYGGWVAFTPQGGGASYRVPFAGFKGDYQSIAVLTPTVNNFPWLARLTGTTFTNKPAGETYSMADAQNIPYILWHSDHQSRLLRMEVFDAVSAKAWHRVAQFDYFGRNSGANTFFSLGWDGQTTSGNKVYTVPDGSYVIKLTVVKALGDAANPADVETWTSPVITIDRP
ncbi:MAG: S8 family serine peptidase, partial [Acidimicrobiales bacterium]